MAERVRDIGSFEGLRSNQLTGYGVVVGLPGTGDDNLEYLTEAMRGVSGRLGMQLPPGVSPGLKNAAAVIITADLPAFAKPGQRIDITVSTLGKAKSLRGGALVLAPLYGADGEIYAMAQGNIAVGGLGVSGRDAFPMAHRLSAPLQRVSPMAHRSNSICIRPISSPPPECVMPSIKSFPPRRGSLMA